MFIELEIADLKVGMYLVEIIAPKGKFQLLDSGLIKNEKTLATLKNKRIERVLVDPSRQKKKPSSTSKQFFQEEIAKAKKVFNESKNIQKKLFLDAENGSPLDLTPVNRITNESIELIFKNPDALTCVLSLRNKDEYLLEHSVAVSVLITIFSFHLKIDKEIIRKLAVGAFLHDVGKIKVPDAILNKPGKLTEAEFEVMKTHASHSIDIIKKTPGIDVLSLEVATLHHEQLSGKGYPHGIRAKGISLYGRMIAICDIFDALTSTRCYKKGMPQVKAFSILRSLAQNNHLDTELVDQFILCMGVYPVGAIVQLDSNRLAIVESHNRQDPIRPKVKPFYHLTEKDFESGKEIDLAINDKEQIVKCVRADDFDLEMSQIIEYLAHQG
ncbi:HD-GYP domain-containing protein [Psychromonas hadalis]|uniref:HD-GYP domain-containing protein n=1 Tax=Psychromonas hadalis TaxID=211669 RepID=UPI0003B6CF6A|nr:HD-GYP domain-containing protein [Psychromonas hadalis]